MKVMKDRFVYKLVSSDKAKDIFSLGLFDLYVIDSESLIDSIDELNEALENGNEIGIPVGNINIHEAKQVLKEAGYFIDSLWHIQDVYNVADGNIQKDQAMQVLSMALTNDVTTDQVWHSIKISIDIVTDKIK